MAETAPHLSAALHNARVFTWWLNWHAVALIVAAAFVAATAESAGLAVVAALSFVALLRLAAEPSFVVATKFGVANGLTTLRLLVLLCAAMALPLLSAEWVLAAFVCNVVLDAIDGYVARKLGQATPFGAVFDREVDALFVLTAYVYLHLTGAFAAWVLLPGLLPYLYRLATAASPVRVAADHKEPFAAQLAALNFLLLLAAVALPDWAQPLVLTSVAVVLVSFGRSFWHLYRHAHPLSE